MPDEKKNGKGPEFDFENLTYRDQKRISFLQMRIQKAMKDLDIEAAETCMDDLEEVYCKLIVSVPRNWLHKDAPENLDWNDRESFGWLLAGKFEELGEAVATAREARSKNS